MLTRSGKVLNGTETEDRETNTRKHDDKHMNKVFYIVFISLILDLLAFTVILPLLPSLMEHYSRDDQSGLYAALRRSITSFRNFVGAPDTPRWNAVLFGGLVGSLFSMLQFLTSPIIGATSDVYGRRPMMLLCLIGVAASYVLWAVSSNFLVFVLARIVGGISKGNVNLCTAIVTDVSPLQKRGKGMALVGVAFSIAFVFGPTIGAGFSKLLKGEEQNNMFHVIPALFSLTLAVIDIVFVYHYLPETLPEEKRQKSRNVLADALRYISPVSLFKFSAVEKISVAEKSHVQSLGATYFLYLFLYSGLEFTLPFLMHNRFDYTSMQQGKMFFFMGTVMAVVQGGYTRRISSGKHNKVAIHGVMILIPSFLLMAFATNTVLMYISLTLFSFASATVVPCMTTAVSMYGGDDEKGTIMGIFRSIGSLSRVLGPIAASTVYWCFGAHACYTVGGLLLLIPLSGMRHGSKEKGKAQ